jgi:hypothetical protein
MRPFPGVVASINAPGGELMHLKGYCVDHSLLRTGSAISAGPGATRQDNDLVALRGASVCARDLTRKIGFSGLASMTYPLPSMWILF